MQYSLEHKSFWTYIQTFHPKHHISFLYSFKYQLSFDYLFMSVLNLKLNSIKMNYSRAFYSSQPQNFLFCVKQ